MKIFTENNAFHNIQNCLDKNCKDVCQAEDFLQFCIQIILYDKIEITPLVQKTITDETSAIIEHLSTEYKIPKDVFTVPAVDNEFIKTMNAVIEHVCNIVQSKIDSFLKECGQFYLDYPSYRNNPISLLPKLDKEAIDHIQYTTEKVKLKDKDFFERTRPMSTFASDGGISKIVSQPDTLDAIFTYVDLNGWDLANSSYLIARIRYLLNSQLAEALPGEITYSPSVVRGRIVRPTNIYLYHLERVIQQLIELKGEDCWQDCFDPHFGGVVMPSLAHFLIEKSKGNVSDILKRAVDLRLTFSDLRKSLWSSNRPPIEQIREILTKLLEHNGISGRETAVVKHAPGSNTELSFSTEVSTEVGLAGPVLKGKTSLTGKTSSKDLVALLGKIRTLFSGKEDSPKHIIALTEIADFLLTHQDNFTKVFIRDCGIN